MNRKALIALLVLISGMGVEAASAQIHCSELPPLAVDAQFPRCSSRELAVAGFPDHKHSYAWHGWEILTDEDGNTYGPGSLCNRKELLPREGLIIEPDRKSYGKFILNHNPEYQDCDMVQFLELLDWADHEVSELLGLSMTDTLEILNPDNTQQYQELTGQNTWRFYALEGNQVTMQPFPVLMARTLVAHGTFMLVTDHILRQSLGTELPPWLHQGIVEYISEDGTHLVNYMAEFRGDKPILMSPPLIDALLARGVDPSAENDREMFRRSSYSSFLMVWHLVENEGGLTALQEFLKLAAEGMDLDRAASFVYGMDMGQLAAYLDPVALGEPIPKNADRQSPHAQP